MITTKTQVKYLEWLSADEMYEESKKWLSELSFIKDEHLFFEDIIKTYTLQLINDKEFSETKEMVDVLNKSQKRNNLLIESVKTHKNDIKILLDGIDQPKEDLIILVSDFFKDYKAIKTHLFRMIKKIMKSEKLRLIDRH